MGPGGGGDTFEGIRVDARGRRRSTSIDPPPSLTSNSTILEGSEGGGVGQSYGKSTVVLSREARY